MEKSTLLSGESVNVEYKVTVPGNSEKYMKTVVAYANGRGGRIIFGVDDKTQEVVGMNTDHIFQTIDAITNAISDSCEPKIIPDVTLQAIDDKTVIVVEIAPGKMRPYYIKSKGLVNGTYIRASGTSRPAADYMLKELILEGQNRYYDCEICEDLAVTQEDIERLCAEMKEAALRNTLTESEKLAVKDVTRNVLLSWGILAEKNGAVVPTNAYALLTGQARFQPVIQCAVFKGKDRAYFVDRREFDGSIQKQMEAAFQYVMEKINRGMRIQGMYRQDVYELPVDSVREMIANSVAHRSYLEPGNIQVALYDDRLEVTSPGMLLSGVSVKKMMEGYSKPRNRAIACAFSYMRIIERWGSGIPRMLRECREYELPEPEFIDFDGDFRVNMYRRALDEEDNTTQSPTQTTQSPTQTTQSPTQTTQSPTQTTQSPTQTTPNPTQTDQADAFCFTKADRTLLALLCEKPELSQKELAMELGWTVDRVKYYLNKMKRRQIIRRVGSSHKGHWELLIKEFQINFH
ncbi:MAG: putative DNA binding domain-containing protein [Blautia sp.]|nr:putative DNA binding domain-containing protein [Blautia sp.]